MWGLIDHPSLWALIYLDCPKTHKQLDLKLKSWAAPQCSESSHRYLFTHFSVSLMIQKALILSSDGSIRRLWGCSSSVHSNILSSHCKKVLYYFWFILVSRLSTHCLSKAWWHWCFASVEVHYSISSCSGSMCNASKRLQDYWMGDMTNGDSISFTWLLLHCKYTHVCMP